MTAFFNKAPNFELITFGKPIKGPDNKYFVNTYLKSDSTQNSEDVICQFGPRLQTKHNLTIESTSLECIFADKSTKDFISDCDDHFLAFCKDNKEEWFNSSEISDSYLDNAIMPSIKAIKKSDMQVVKFRTSSQMNIFDSSKEKIEIDNIQEESKISAIVQLAGLWFTKTRFGITWKLKQIKLHNEKPKSGGAYLFDDVDDDELDNVFPDE
jgi:hypothetical protein